MLAFNMQRRELVAARKHEALLGKKIIGRGFFCAVFDGTRPDTVLKLTADQYSYAMTADAVVGIKHPAFPRLVHDYGEVGEFFVGGEEYPLYLFETERLRPLNKRDRRGAAMNTARSVTFAEIRTWRATPYQTLIDMAEKELSGSAMGEAVRELADFVSHFDQRHVGIDLHYGNFMQRESGEVVLNDPIMDKRLHQLVWQSTRR